MKEHANSEVFLAKLWAAFAAEDYVDEVERDRSRLTLHTPSRPYTMYDEKRSMSVVVDAAVVLGMRDQLLEEIRARGEWDDLDDDAAVIEQILAKLEEGVLSAYSGVTALEFFHGFFRPDPSSPPRSRRRARTDL